MNNSNPGPSGTRGQSAGGSFPAAMEEYACKFPGCGRSFKTKTGRGLHHRKAHADWYDSQQNTAQIKARWNDEETRMLARKEAELTLQDTRFMNQALLLVFPDRSLEAIKGKRKQPAYRQLVQELLKDMSAEVDDDIVQDPGDNCSDFKTAIADYLVALPPPRNSDFNAPRLVQICNSLTRNAGAKILEKLALYLAEVFPARERKATKCPMAEAVNLSKKHARKAEYARTQDLWRKNRKKCIRMTLDDISGVKVPSQDVMVPYWRTVMISGEDTLPTTGEHKPSIPDLWSPVTPSEVGRAKPG